LSAYRTINERPELFRTPRSRREAGIGEIDTKVPSAEFVALLRAELQREQTQEPGGFFLMLGGACLGGLGLWGLLVLLFSVATPNDDKAQAVEATSNALVRFFTDPSVTIVHPQEEAK
jgi:hypothetical protein